MIVEELIAILGFKVQGEAEAKRFQSRLASMDKGLAAFAARATQIGAVVGTAFAGLGVALGKSVIHTAGQFEAFEARLTSVYKGNTEAAKESLSWIEKFAATTPYELEGVTDAFVKLVTYGIDPLANDALRTLGDASAAMGKPLMQSVEALADAMTGQMERLKEFGIRAEQQGDQVTFAWTRNGKAFSETVKKNGADIQKFLLDFWQQEFGGGMMRASKTWGGMLSNLGDSWTLFKRRIATAGGEDSFFNNVKNRLAGLLDYIAELDRSGALDRVANKLGTGFVKAFDTIASVSQRMSSHAQTLFKNWQRFVPLVTGLGMALAGLAVRAHPVIAALAAIALAVEDLLSYMEGGESVIGSFFDALTKNGQLVKAEDIAKNIGELVVSIPITWAFGAATRGGEGSLSRLIENTKKEFSEIGKFLSGETNVISTYLNEYSNVFFGFLQGIDNAIDKSVLAPLNDAFRAIAQWSEKAGKEILKAFDFTGKAQEQFEALQRFIEGLDWFGTGARIMDSIWKGMMSVFSGLRDWWTQSFSNLNNQTNVPDAVQGYRYGGTSSGGVSGNYRSNMIGSEPVEPELPSWESDEDMLNRLKENIDRQKRPSGGGEDPFQSSRIYYERQTINRAAPTVQINQTVTQATDAPKRAAEATGRAVSKAVSTEYYTPSRMELEPALP